MLLPLFHLSVAFFDAFTLWYDQNYVELPVKDGLREQMKGFPFKARFLFLTIWCLVFQTVYFTIAFLNDVIGTNAPAPKKPPIIRVIKDTLFSLAFPLALFVGIAFWSIYAYDKDLILPENVRKVFPVWVNHSMHSTIVPFIILELILSSITYPSRKVGISFSLIFILAYLGLLATLFVKTGSMVYPVINVMPLYMKVGFLSIGSLLGLTLYLVGELLNKIIHPRAKGSDSKSSSKTSKKIKKRV